MSLKAMRKKAGYTQNDLANVTGLHPKYISMYESGARNINGAKLSTLLLLCSALSCKIEDLLNADADDDVLELWEGYLDADSSTADEEEEDKDMWAF